MVQATYLVRFLLPFAENHERVFFPKSPPLQTYSRSDEQKITNYRPETFMAKNTNPEDLFR
jgi:hypothetical protein